VGLAVVQDAMQFVGKMAYHDFGGVADEEEEMELVSQVAKGGADVVVLRNHGILVLGEDVERAYSRLYYYERACQCQLLVMVRSLLYVHVLHSVHSVAANAGTAPESSRLVSLLWCRCIVLILVQAMARD
jgi:ribulose-5-phosphate 4-epimerase/fuculose-1-phosphate aldolase